MFKAHNFCNKPQLDIYVNCGEMYGTECSMHAWYSQGIQVQGAKIDPRNLLALIMVFLYLL